MLSRFFIVCLLFCVPFSSNLFAICSNDNCAACSVACQAECCFRQTLSSFVPSASNPTVGVANVTITNNPNGTLTVSVQNLSGFAATINLIVEFDACVESTGFQLANSAAQSTTLACPSCPTEATLGFVKVSLNEVNSGNLLGEQEFEFNFCCACTRSQGYWQCHTDCWPVSADKPFCELLADLYSTVNTVLLCSNQCTPTLTLKEIMDDTSGTLWYCLAKQWIAAYINFVRVYGGGFSLDESYLSCIGGTSPCGSNFSTFDYAAFILANTVCTQEITSTDIDPAKCLKKRLETFNLGLLDGVSCPNYCDACNAGETCTTCADCAALVANNQCSCQGLGCSSAPPTVNCALCQTECNLCHCFTSSSSSSSSSSSKSSWFSKKGKAKKKS